MSPSSASGSDAQAGGGSEITPPVTPANDVIYSTPPPKVLLPQPVKKSKQGEGGGSLHHQHTSSAGASETKRGKMMSGSSSTPPVNLVQMLTDIDDHFLKASESAIPVSRMLEATRLHYHSNFADSRGHIDHSARVMKVITWNRSFKGLSNNDDGKDDLDNEELETHATVLDKLLAWEKKLYDEVKAGEHMKIRYQKKVTELNRQKKNGANPNKLEKTKAEVSHLHTRYIVDMQSMDSTVSEIQRLRDHQLYPKLDALVNGMAGMWETMHTHHNEQLKIVMQLRSLDISSTPKMTTLQHYNMTDQLFKMATEWHLEFEKLITHQKEYIQHLHNWLKSNIIPIESTLKEKVSSPLRVHTPPIQHLVHAWNDHLGNLPDDIAKHAISSFAAVIEAILTQQREEMKQKDKCEALKKEYNKKLRIHADWKEKTQSLMTTTTEGDQEGTENVNLKAEREVREFELEGIKNSLIQTSYIHWCLLQFPTFLSFLLLLVGRMAQLPPKIPNIATPNWSKFGYQKMPTISDINENQQQLSWIEEFLDFSSTKRGVHRRSASVDSVTFLEEEPPLMSEFDRFDDHQLMSIFSNDIKVTPPLHNNNQSSQSDDNDSNSEEGKLQEVKTEKVEAPPLSAAAEASIVDPKRVKRILANRQSAQRSRVRKMQYISELEKSVTYLQTEVWALSPRVAFLDQQRSILTVDNGALRQRITALTQDKIFKDAHQEALKKEIERLSQVYHQLNLEKIASTSTTPTEAGIATSMESISCEKDKLSDEEQQQQ